MASGRINRNEFLGLDSQPEGVWRVLNERGDRSVQNTIAWSVWCPVSSSVPDDTELPRLTSDFLLRRGAGGEILMSVNRRGRFGETGPS